MAKMYTTSKTNPITGDPVNNSSLPGSTGSKREERKNASGKLTRRQNKALNQGVEKQKAKIQYKGVPETKDWRSRSKIGAVLHGTPIPHKDKGGEKNMSTKTPAKKKGLGIVPKSCRGPKEWTR